MKLEDNKIIVIFVVVALVGVLCGVAAGLSKKNGETTANEYSNEIKSLKYIDNIPQVIKVDEAVKKGYFVYDGQNNKVYNKNVLDNFVENTKIDAIKRISDEICIVAYNISGEPIIYDLVYDISSNKYTYAYDYTRVKSYESPIEESSNLEMRDKIITINNIAGDNYEIKVVEDTDFNVAIVLLKAYNNNENYKDIEIARYLLNAEIIKIE